MKMRMPIPVAGLILAAIVAGGWFDFDPAEVLAAAEGMDARADALSQSAR